MIEQLRLIEIIERYIDSRLELLDVGDSPESVLEDIIRYIQDLRIEIQDELDKFENESA